MGRHRAAASVVAASTPGGLRRAFRAAAAPSAAAAATQHHPALATVADAGPGAPAAPVAPLQQQPQLPAPSPISSGPATTASAGVPIHQVRFPPSPSPLLVWLAGSSPQPVYMMASEPPYVHSQPVPTLQYGRSSSAAGPYAGLDGQPFHGGPPVSTEPAPPPSLLRTDASYSHGGHTHTPPCFAKLDFATYDVTEDPLNWLDQCEQFFWRQRTLASDRT
nr:vegetative cell wall protein gp1-like [Aegilops tauschii subsp. strangulata]